jgi:hypothetical protein
VGRRCFRAPCSAPTLKGPRRSPRRCASPLNSDHNLRPAALPELRF